MNQRQYLNMLNNDALSGFRLIAPLLVFSLHALALPEDSGLPINIQSDSARQTTLEAGEKTEYFGNVVITQGSLKINGEHIVIHSQERKVTSIVATGSPAQFEQQSDPAKSPIKAQANTLNYKLNNDTVVLTENAIIEQDGTTVSGDRIEYNIGSEQVKASGGKEDSSRVQMILIPENNQETDDANTNDAVNTSANQQGS